MKSSSYLTATDQFCGAGGTSIGVKEAGIELKMALNHWKLAIETHNTNHPEADHDCTDISACNPRRYPSTNMLFTSPECTNHSVAQGKKRKHQGQYKLWKEAPKAEEERSRATMWDVPRFAEFHGYDIVVVENVVDARRWAMWDAWLMAMHCLGYKHECLYLNSMFFPPCPQSRDRMYVVFWKKGNRAPDLEYRPLAPCSCCGKEVEAYQSWKNPEKKWGKYGIRNGQYVYRCSKCYNVVVPYYYAAMNIIDWSVPITRIGDRKKPLAAKTLKRIQYGLDTFGDRQMIVTSRYSSGIACRVKPADTNPFPAQPGDSAHFLLSSVMMDKAGHKDTNVRMGSDSLYTQTTFQEQHLLALPGIVKLRNNQGSEPVLNPVNTCASGGIHTGLMIVRNNHQNRPTSPDRPIGTMTTGLQHGLLMGNYTPGWTRGLDKPAGTMTTTAQQGLITHKALNSFLTYYYGNTQVSGMDAPIGTMSTVDRAALTIPAIEDCYYRVIKAHEVQRAMAFEDVYTVLGNSKDKVRQLGNAVTPPVMAWIAKRCAQSLEKCIAL